MIEKAVELLQYGRMTFTDGQRVVTFAASDLTDRVLFISNQDVVAVEHKMMLKEMVLQLAEGGFLEMPGDKHLAMVEELLLLTHHMKVGERRTHNPRLN